MTDPLVEARIRAQLYRYRDGLLEIGLGTIFLLQGGFNLIMYFGDHHSSRYSLTLLMYIGLTVAISLFALRIKTAVLQRVRYPRRGYVRELGRERGVIAMMIGVLVFMFAFWEFLGYARQADWDLDPWFQWAPALLGLMNVSYGVYMTVRYGLRRFLVVGGFALVLGIEVSIDYSQILAMGICFIGIGGAWLCSGGIALRNCLQTVPPSADAK